MQQNVQRRHHCKNQQRTSNHQMAWAVTDYTIFKALALLYTTIYLFVVFFCLLVYLYV